MGQAPGAPIELPVAQGLTLEDHGDRLGRTFDLRFDPAVETEGAARQVGRGRVPLPELVALRNQVLERRVLSLKRGRIEAERTRNEELRRDLELAIEEERSAAEARAQQQRRDLRIEPEEPETP